MADSINLSIGDVSSNAANTAEQAFNSAEVTLELTRVVSHMRDTVASYKLDDTSSDSDEDHLF